MLITSGEVQVLSAELLAVWSSGTCQTPHLHQHMPNSSLFIGSVFVQLCKITFLDEMIALCPQ
jgi:hypothetical protein